MSAFLSAARDLPFGIAIRVGNAVRQSRSRGDLRSRVAVGLGKFIRRSPAVRLAWVRSELRVRRWLKDVQQRPVSVDLRARLVKTRAWTADFNRDELLTVMHDLQTRLTISTRRAACQLRAAWRSAAARDLRSNLALAMEKAGQWMPGPPVRDLQTRLAIGLITVALLVFGVGGWMATAQLSSAVIANGLIVVDSNVKKVQHPTGGVVGQILVHNGDRVAPHDLLLRLDETQARAALGIIVAQLVELQGRKARLMAERDDLNEVAFPEDFAGSGDDAKPCDRGRAAPV